MLPRQSPPVARRFRGGGRTLFPTALQIVSTPEVINPDVVKHIREVITGANPNPNDPQRFLYPLSCFQDCSILSGLSFLQCMRGCRR
jgi:hypothetical protein